MAMSSWMAWNRSLRSGRPSRSRHAREENSVELDLSKGIKENNTECLINVCQPHGVSGKKKLAYLNALVNLVNESDTPEFGYSTEELFCCLRMGLVHQATQVRAATLRAMRYMLRKEQDVIVINKLQYPYLIARSMDVNLRNEIERIQALRLVRKIYTLAPKHLSPALVRALVSITNGGMEEKDRAFRVFLAALCELGVLNSGLLISCGGVSALARATTTGQSPQITEAVVGVLLKLLSNPETRSNVSLLYLAAPYCELETLGLDRTKEDWDQTFASSKHALLSVLRSYTGVMHFCHPEEKSGIKALSDILYVEKLGLRGAILELFYELLGLPLPTWTDEPDVALAAVDPERFRNSWKLSDGFVAAEAQTILPSLKIHCPNITELHLALLVQVLLECGLHRALAQTIVSSDTFITVRAAVLLGALLHLAHSLLPPEVCDQTPPLPDLLEQASAGRHQALAAVDILGRVHTMMRRRPMPDSLFLARLLQAGDWLAPGESRSLRRQTSLRHWLKRESPMAQLLKESQVLSSKDALAWDWVTVRSILRLRDETFRSLQDSDSRMFIKKLVKYFRPTANQYSRLELTTYSEIPRNATLAGCDLINFLLELENEIDRTRFLDELMGDIAEQLIAIRIAQSAHDVLFSPRHVTTTCCQYYFLFIGLLSASIGGCKVLKRFGILEKIQDLAMTTKHDCYVKLVVSSIDITRDGYNRRVYAKIVQDSQLESTRMYATLILGTMVRAKMKDASHWVLILLLNRLSDKSKIVASVALDALHEACEEPMYLAIVFDKSKEKIAKNFEQWLQNLGDKGHLLKIRLYSLNVIYTTTPCPLPSPAEELENWIKPGGWAERYAGITECDIHDSLTRRQRDENGSYLRRSNGNPILSKDVYVLPHLIGQLVQHEFGLQLLLRRNVFQRFARVVQRFRMEYGNGSGQNKEAGGSKDENKGEDRKIDESTRLETIVDSEMADRSEVHTQQKTEPFVEIRRKLSQDDSRRTTPERNWRGELDSREEHAAGLEGRILKVKAALWALGHAGTSSFGVEQLNNLNIIEMITSIAETCPYYTVRATALYALCLISTTRAGADVLILYDWPCVRYKRGDNWPVQQPRSISQSQQSSSPVPIQRHHRSLSDGKPELPEPLVKRQRNRSESAATDMEARRYILPERGETPSPMSSALRMDARDAEGHATFRNLQRQFNRPSDSHSSLEVYNPDGRLSLQSLFELESSRNCIVESSPPQQRVKSASSVSQDNIDSNARYMGISLPLKLSAIFPQTTPSNLLLEKANKSRSTFEMKRRRTVSAGDASGMHDDLAFRLLNKQSHNANESDSECFSPIPTIILEEKAKNSIGAESMSKLSVNESDPPSTLNRLLPPEKHRTISSSRYNASDMEEETCSEYETTSDHSRICLYCFRERSLSNDSVSTDIDFRRSVDKVRRDVLRQALRLANPVFYKQSRQTLLRLRQNHPHIFQDVCMYSEVASYMASNSYRIQARRFLQELFLDSSFESLLAEPAAILKMTLNAPTKDAPTENKITHVPILHASAIISPSHKSSKVFEPKINGRLAVAPEDQQSIDNLSVVNEENALMMSESPISDSVTSSQRSSGVVNSLTNQRRTDERIIAEILRPEERTRTSRNSDRLLRVAGINTAVSLD